MIGCPPILPFALATFTPPRDFSAIPASSLPPRAFQRPYRKIPLLSGLNLVPVEALSTTDTTSTPAPATAGTYLSNKYQDLLLYACLVNAYGYLKGPTDMLQYYQSQYNEAIESYAIEQIGQRRRDEYQDGEVRAQLNVKPPSSYT